MIVRARRTSPPSRCSCLVAASIREIDRVTRISAPSLRACCSARLASSSPDTPDGKQVVLDPRGRARLAARSLPLDDDRLQAFRCSVDGCGEPRRTRAHDHCVVLRGLRLGTEVEQLGHSAVMRSYHGLAADDPDRRPVRLGRQGAAQRSSASGASGVSHLNVTWLRSRNRRSSAQEASQRCSTTMARGGGGSAAIPCSPRVPPIRSAASLPTSSRHPAPRPQRRGSREARAA